MIPKLKVGDSVKVSKIYLGRPIPVFGMKTELDISQVGTITVIMFKGDYYKHGKSVVATEFNPEYVYLVRFPSNASAYDWAFAEDEIELFVDQDRVEIEEEFYREAIL